MYHWIYTQFSGDSVFINMILHFGSMFGENNEPYVSYGYFNQRKHISERESIKINGSHFDDLLKSITMPGLQAINLQVGSLRISGAVSRICHEKPETFDLVSSDRSPQDDGFWLIRIPYGVFSGTITINNEEQDVSAIVYQDEQWGEEPLLSSLSEWVWAVASDKSSNYGVFSSVSKNGKKVFGKWYGSENDYRFVTSDEYASLLSKQLKEMRNPILISDHAFYCDYQNAMRKRKMERHGDFFFNYYRYLLNARENEGIRGACEIMYVQSTL